MTIHVNAQTFDIKSSVDTPLLYVLRDELGLHGPRFGCGLGHCGACTVPVGDRAVRSCRVPVGSVSEPVTTLEGLAVNGQLHPVQQVHWLRRRTLPLRPNNVPAAFAASGA